MPRRLCDLTSGDVDRLCDPARADPDPDGRFDPEPEDDTEPAPDTDADEALEEER